MKKYVLFMLTLVSCWIFWISVDVHAIDHRHHKGHGHGDFPLHQKRGHRGHDGSHHQTSRCMLVLKDTFAGSDEKTAKLLLSMIQNNEFDKINNLISRGEATRFKKGEKAFFISGMWFFWKNTILRGARRAGEEKTWVISTEDLAPADKSLKCE